jgi:hypothetical protein
MVKNPPDTVCFEIFSYYTPAELISSNKPASRFPERPLARHDSSSGFDDNERADSGKTN